MGVTSYSYVINDDGDGFYSDGLLVRSENKINFFKFNDLVTNSKVNICHQRLATSGLSSKYIQPFMNEEFVLVHNGVINDFLGKKGSDTYGFFKKFIKVFKKRKKGNREEKIIATIKKLFDGLDRGSYSIALFDKVTENLYYFKNSFLDINFYKSSEMLFITTNSNNSVFLKAFDDTFYEKDIKEYKIYRITTKDKIKINVVGKIKEKEFVSFFKDKKVQTIKNYPTIKEETTTTNDGMVIIADDMSPCVECGNLTYNLHPTYLQKICDTCLSEFDTYDDYNKGRYDNCKRSRLDYV